MIRLIFFLLICFSNFVAASFAEKGATNQQLSIQLNEQGIKAVKDKNFNEAEELFKKSLSTDSGNITAAFNLAGILLNNKRIDEAVTLLKSYLKVYPNDVGLYVRLGDCYFAEKQLDDALLNYEKAMNLDPKYSRLMSKLGTIYGLKGQMKKSEEIYRLAVLQNPKDLNSKENLSVLLITNGKAHEAVPLIKSALRLDSSAYLYRLLGQAYHALGDKENEAIALQRAKELDVTVEN